MSFLGLLKSLSFEILGISIARKVVFSWGDDDDDNDIITPTPMMKISWVYAVHCAELSHMYLALKQYLALQMDPSQFTDEETKVSLAGLRPHSNQ